MNVVMDQWIELVNYKSIFLCCLKFINITLALMIRWQINAVSLSLIYEDITSLVFGFRVAIRRDKLEAYR